MAGLLLCSSEEEHISVQDVANDLSSYPRARGWKLKHFTTQLLEMVSLFMNQHCTLGSVYCVGMGSEMSCRNGYRDVLEQLVILAWQGRSLSVCKAVFNS